MIIKKPQFFLFSLTVCALLAGFHAQADIFDEEIGNSLDQGSLNSLNSELQDLEKNESYSQVYLPSSSLPKPTQNEWGEETKLAQEDTILDENSDEVKRKEAAIMRDLEEHAKPLEGTVPSNSSDVQEKVESKKEEPSELVAKPTKEFKPRQRVR